MKNLIVIVCLSAMFFSCAKKIQPEPGVPSYCRIHSVNDSTGKPKFYVDYIPNTNKISGIYFKDTTGKLVPLNGYKYYYDKSNNLDSVNLLGQKYYFTYYDNGLILTFRYKYNTISDLTISYKYLNNDLIEKISVYANSLYPDTILYSDYYNGKPKYSYHLKDTAEYEYDSDMDLIKTYKVENNKRYLSVLYEYDKNAKSEAIYEFYKQMVFENYGLDNLNLNSNDTPKHQFAKATFYNLSGDIARIINYENIRVSNFGFVTHYKQLESYPQSFNNVIYSFTYQCQ